MRKNEISMIAQAAFIRNQVNEIMDRVERENPEDEGVKKQREVEAFMQPIAFPGDLTDISQAHVTIKEYGSRIVAVEPSLNYNEDGELQTILRPTGIIFDAQKNNGESTDVFGQQTPYFDGGGEVNAPTVKKSHPSGMDMNA